MRGNARSFPDAQPTLAQNRTSLLNWLYGARDEMVLGMTVETLAQRHKIHARPVENARRVEALLSAAQGRIRRRMEAMANPI